MDYDIKPLSGTQRFYELYTQKEPLTIEEAAIRIIALMDIEGSDRAGANHLEAGTSIMYINNLFDALEASEVLNMKSEVIQNAISAWSDVKEYIRRTNNNGRMYDAIGKVKKELGI